MEAGIAPPGLESWPGVTVFRCGRHDLSFPSLLHGHQNDDRDTSADHEAWRVSKGEGYWILVQLAARGKQPDATEPKNHAGHNQPEVVGVVVEPDDVETADVVGEDHDGSESAGCTERAHLLDVGHEVSTAVFELLSGEADVFEFCEALDDSEGKKKEDCESGQPVGDRRTRGRSAGEQAECVKAREDNDVDESDAFEVKGISDGAGYVEKEPEHECERQGSCHGDAEDQESGGDDESGGGREVTGSEGTRAFSSTVPV